MGVDYTASCGIGFQLRQPQSNEKFENEYDGDFENFFYGEISNLIDDSEDFEYFITGEGNYVAEEENEIFVVVNGKLSDGWDEMKKKTAQLHTFLWNLDLINLDDTPEVVGGLLVH
ncbi:hypothetical protein [Chryseobacterium mulctrae]|uniref:hypothetical protein n=1 Tax=Chryseobacterium mulctrae TaxID=2576777 RepID=UPI001116B158|nr:hypothetical protein [Chryseobacterium mulctrae]